MLHLAPMRRAGIGLAALIGCAITIAFAGCGGGSGDNGLDTPAGRTAQAYVDAYNGKHFTRLCEMLSESYKDERQIGPGGSDEEGEERSKCGAYFREHTSGAETTLTLEEVRVDGNVAKAHVKIESQDSPAGNSDQTVGLEEQPDGSWLVTDVTSGFS
jgi:ketosteroid isomerase-like protein